MLREHRPRAIAIALAVGRRPFALPAVVVAVALSSLTGPGAALFLALALATWALAEG